MSEQLTKNFTREEFACKCGCGSNKISLVLVTALQTLRDMTGKPLTIDSGCRCRKHNAAEGGAKNSQHLLGTAADVRIQGLTARQIFALASHIPAIHGFGVDDERSFVHLDVRPTPAHWCYHNGKETPWHEA